MFRERHCLQCRIHLVIFFFFFFLTSPCFPSGLLCCVCSFTMFLAYPGIHFIQLELHYCPEAAAHTKLCAGDSSVQNAVSLWSVLWSTGERGLPGKGVQGLYTADWHSPSAPTGKGKSQ